MFWGFGYFNNPFMLNTFFMPNFFFNFGFSNFCMPNLFMPSLFMFSNPYSNVSIFANRPNYSNTPMTAEYPMPTRHKKHMSAASVEQNTPGNAPARRVKTELATSSSKISHQTITHDMPTAKKTTVTQTITHDTPTAKKTTATQTITHDTPTAKKTTVTQTIRHKASTDKKDSAFLQKTKQIAKRLNCDYKDLLALMNSESGLNSKAVNSSSGATGLIQFIPSTAKDLGTTTEKLKNMTPTEQLDYVEKYLVKMKKAAGFKSGEKLDSGDLYALVFLPGRAKREIVTDSSEKYYAVNAPALDLNKDGKITKTELAQRLNGHRVSDSIFLA